MDVTDTTVFTDFTDVYRLFLAKITNCRYLQLTEDELTDELETLLKIGLARFPQLDTEPDYITKQFPRELTLLEQDILSLFMVVGFISRFIASTTLLSQSLSTKDFAMYSQANHLKELMEAKKSAEKEALYWTTRYSTISMIESGGF